MQAAAGEPQFALPGQPHSLVAFDGATFQDQLNRGLVDLNALQLSERVQSAGRNFHSQVLWPALSGGAASDKAADNAQVQLHSLSRVLAVHWRRNDFVSLRSSQHGVLLAPSELVAAIRCVSLPISSLLGLGRDGLAPFFFALHPFIYALLSYLLTCERFFFVWLLFVERR